MGKKNYGKSVKARLLNLRRLSTIVVLQTILNYSCSQKIFQQMQYTLPDGKLS